MFSALHDRDRDRDFDYDADSDVDDSYVEERSAPRARASKPLAGFGSERRDVADADPDFMPMTRRDVDSLYKSSLDRTRNFFASRETCDPTATLGGLALTASEIAAGAAAAAFLAQRFRQAGAVVPVGAILGAVGLAGAQFDMFGKLSPDVRNVSLGAIASAVALWAAGRGIVSAEEATRGAVVVAPQAPAPVAQPPMMQQPMRMPPTSVAAPSYVDFQNLVARRTP